MSGDRSTSPVLGRVTNANGDTVEVEFDGDEVWLEVRNDAGDGGVAKMTRDQAQQVVAALQRVLASDDSGPAPDAEGVAR